ncbi:hypothetical protein [Lysinibacter sp. HNR]|uniref:hypothetical protein n=1 Tax=Lysinibacter sp. HNR TaxID=3031408 RepID=UPI002434F65A|nr:hypothetical protein [Lysinibacter sp. HNR]WGD37944.1 hypothetical protein FrondiHNR_03240 [Lysinibacter sp. HNR]
MSEHVSTHNILKKWWFWVSILTISAVAAFLAVPSGGTFALWRASEVGASDTLTLGNLAFQLRDKDGQNPSPSDPAENAPPSYSFTDLTDSASDLIPGNTAIGVLRAHNTGTTPLTLSIFGIRFEEEMTDTQSELLNKLVIATWRSASASCVIGPSETFTPFSEVDAENPLALVPATSALAPQGSTYVCVAVRLLDDAPNSVQAQTVPFVFDIRADQHR